MAVRMKLKSSLPRFYSISLSQLQLQWRLAHSFVEPGFPAPTLAASTSTSTSGGGGSGKMGREDAKGSLEWRKLDSRTLGISLSMIPDSTRIVVKILQGEGHDAYLVGGCVRDLILNRIPKDFDVVTSANLKQIRTIFHRAFIVGRKFPICHVRVRGATIEVSSFDTVANNVDPESHHHHQPRPSHAPSGFSDKDFVRCKDSFRRDFTINSLFYDPFAHKIYDYSNGIADLKARKLRTLCAAHVSFEEDSARILRGLRIAARLGFSFAKDTDKAIRKLSDSILTLSKPRIMMEMNYMLSYGAAEPSLLLLHRFKILELLLPFQAAYLSHRSDAQSPVMLMKLFFNLDKVASCDQPCNSSVWVSLLGFHLALVNNPQEALVVWTFASLLFHGKWKEGLKAARELSVEHFLFKPEIYTSSDELTDEELGQRVARFAVLVVDSIYTLTDSESLWKAMARYGFPAPSGLVFLSINTAKEVSKIFKVLMDDIESLREERHNYSIDYELLGRGDIPEVRFVLGKIIMDTMRGGQIYGRTKFVTEKQDDLCESEVTVENVQAESVTSLVAKCRDRTEEGSGEAGDQQYHKKNKKQKQNRHITEMEQKLVKQKLGNILSSQETAQKRHQLRKTVVKDVRNLLSCQKEVTVKKSEMESGLSFDAQTGEATGVLGNVPEILDRDAQACNDGILGALEIRKRYTAHGPEEVLSGLKKVPQLAKQLQEESSAEMVNVISLSSVFKANKNPSKGLCNTEKQPTAGDPQHDKSIPRKRKLSNIFK